MSSSSGLEILPEILLGLFTVTLLTISDLRRFSRATRSQRRRKIWKQIQLSFLYSLHFWNFNIISLIKLKRFAFSSFFLHSLLTATVLRRLVVELSRCSRAAKFLIITKKNENYLLLRLLSIITLMSSQFREKISLVLHSQAHTRCFTGSEFVASISLAQQHVVFPSTLSSLIIII